MSTTLEIPSQFIDQIQNLLENLSVKEARRERVENIHNDTVIKIIDHIVSDHNFMFLVKWGDGVEEWVDDNDCCCEILINNYLRNINIKTAYIICRVSTKNQDDPNCLSLDAQHQEILTKVSDLYERKKVVKIKKSAYSSVPKEILDICHSATNNDGIFFWKIDRFSRNIEKSINLFKILETKKVFVYSLQENLVFQNNKSEVYQYVLNGQKESEDISKRIKLTLRKKLERGDEKIGGLPYGKKYKRILNEEGETLKMIVVNNETEMCVIKEIKNANNSIKNITSNLNSKGIRKKGRKWSDQMVARIKKQSF